MKKDKNICDECGELILNNFYNEDCATCIERKLKIVENIFPGVKE